MDYGQIKLFWYDCVLIFALLGWAKSNLAYDPNFNSLRFFSYCFYFLFFLNFFFFPHFFLTPFSFLSLVHSLSTNSSICLHFLNYIYTFFNISLTTSPYYARKLGIPVEAAQREANRFSGLCRLLRNGAEVWAGIEGRVSKSSSQFSALRWVLKCSSIRPTISAPVVFSFRFLLSYIVLRSPDSSFPFFTSLLPFFLSPRH